MKMKFMPVNARDGENVEQAVHTLVADTIAYQKLHCNDVIDPWATPSSADSQQPVSWTVSLNSITIYYIQCTCRCHFLLCPSKCTR